MEEDFEDFQAMGLNVIRIHVFDTEITDAVGNLVRNEHLDLLDYLVAQCNRRGMYLMLTPIAWWGSPGARPDSFSSQHAEAGDVHVAGRLENPGQLSRPVPLP